MADDDFENENAPKGNIVQRINEFIYSSKRVLNVAKKPDWNEYKGIAKISAIGVGVIGMVGFIVILVFTLLRGV